MTKPEHLDCIAVKRRAQRELAKALAGKPPDEQAKILHRLAAQAPLWKRLSKSRAQERATAARTDGKRRSTG
jgi:hypothetical protein